MAYYGRSILPFVHPVPQHLRQDEQDSQDSQDVTRTDERRNESHDVIVTN